MVATRRPARSPVELVSGVRMESEKKKTGHFNENKKSVQGGVPVRGMTRYAAPPGVVGKGGERQMVKETRVPPPPPPPPPVPSLSSSSTSFFAISTTRWESSSAPSRMLLDALLVVQSHRTRV